MEPVQLSPHCSRWQHDFAQIRAELLGAFAPQVVDVEHIGSTAVPGLCAKPVIDVVVGAQSLQQVEAAVGALDRAGYAIVRKYEVELPGRRYFVRPAGALPRVHVHAVCKDSTILRRHLAFRNALRADAGLRDRYAALKQELARLHAHDKSRYTLAKAPFILEVLAAAGEGAE